MRETYILCEGETEEAFVRSLLAPYLRGCGVAARSVLLGGVDSYRKIRRELGLLSRQHPEALITSMIDYYAMPRDTPEIACADQSLHRRIRRIERAIGCDIGCANVAFHFSLHEFEALLFSEPEAFSLIAGEGVVGELAAIRRAHPTPEYINTSPKTAPSKRILRLIPRYAKVADGARLAKRIGMPRMLEECEHFAAWVDLLQSS